MRRPPLFVRCLSVCLLVPFLVAMLNPGPAIAAMRAVRAERERTIGIARNLGVDPELLLDPEAYRRKQAKLAEERRKKAVAEMLARHAPDPDKLADLERQVAEVEDAHAIHQLAGLADDVTDLDSAIDWLGADDSAPQRIVALERASFAFTDDTIAAYDRAVKQRLSSLPGRFAERHRALLSKARADLAPIASRLRSATRDGKVDRRALRDLRPKLKRLASPRSSTLRPPLRTDRPARVVAPARRGESLVAGPSLQRAQEAFRPGPIDLARSLGSRGGGSWRVGVAPLPWSVVAPLVAPSVTAALAPPAPADFLGTVDAPLAPEIVALAAALGHDPVRIFNFVHDTVDTQIYKGSRRGAVGTLAERAGNDFDQASLLVALLRAAGFAARYEWIGVRLAPEQWRGYTGVDVADQAASMLETAGIDTVITTDPSGVDSIDTFVMAVRAFVPYANYRGVVASGAGESAWVRLVPSLKSYATQSAVDLRPGALFDFGAHLAGLTTESPLEAWQAQLRAYALANDLECATLAAAQPRRSIVAEALPYLRAESPAPVLAVVGAPVASLPENLRESVRLRLIAPGGVVHFDRIVSLSELYGRRVTITYPPATADDAAVIASHGGLEATPLYLVALRPELRIGDEVVALGAAQPAGIDNDLRIDFLRGASVLGFADHVSRSGSLYVWSVDHGAVPLDRLDAAESALAAAPAGSDEADLARLHLMTQRWFYAYDEARDEIAGVFHSRVSPDVSEALFSYELHVTHVGGAPLSGTRDTVLLDVGRTLGTPFAVDGDDTHRAHQLLLLGHHSSALEHIIPAAHHGPNQYSAVRFIQQAHASGIPVFDVTAEEVEAILPSLSVDADTQDAIRDKAKPGRRLLVPQTTFTPPAYRPVYGFLSVDEATGAGEYMFQGVFDGGGGPDGDPPPGSGPGCGGCGAGSGPAGSRVIFGRGNYTDGETDLMLPVRGTSIAFTRAYHSFFPSGGGRLGPGWIHSYASYLRPTASGVTFVTTSGEWPFAADGVGGFVEPPELRARLAVVPGGHELRWRTGTVWSFDSNGRHASIVDLNGRAIALLYDPTSGVLTEVVDPTGRTALTFAYDVDLRLERVIDTFGRTVLLGHDVAGRLTSVTDVLGNSKTLAYDDHGRLTSKTDWNGNVWTISYDEHGRWIRTVDPTGHSYRAVYDYATNRVVHFDRRGAVTLTELGPAGQRLAVTDALGNRTRYEYDARLNLTEVSDPRGAVTRMAYDAEDNLIEEVSPSGTVTRHAYGAFGRRTTTIEDVSGLALTTLREYDSRGNLIRATDPQASVVEFVHTADGLIASITEMDPFGDDAVTTIAYHANGHVDFVTDPEGGTTTLAYDAFGHLSRVTNPNGNTRTVFIDAKGRVLSTAEPGLPPTTYRYDAQGNVLSISDPRGFATTSTYDVLNRPVAVTDAAGDTQRVEYDEEGMVVAQIDAAGNRTTFEYDAIGRFVRATDAEGHSILQGYCADDPGDEPCDVIDALGNLVRSVSYDIEGRPLIVEDALGFHTIFGYDALGRQTAITNRAGDTSVLAYDGADRLVSVTDPLFGVTSYGYDARGNQTSVIDANGDATTYTYDRSNRLLTQTTPNGTNWSFTYDAAGDRVTERDANGNTTILVYDANNRLLEKHFADGMIHRFDYDAAGNRTMEDAPGITRTFTYDPLGRVSTVTDHRFTPPKVLTYTYDERGNRASMTLSPDGLVTRYRYDRRGLLAELTDPDGDVTRFTYDAVGRRTSLQHPNGVTGRYEYNDRSDVTLIAWQRATGQVLQSFGYSYDPRGNRLSKAYEDGGVERYGYDALSRLPSVVYPGGQRYVTYQYDPVGNRLRMEERTLTDVEQPVPGCNPILDTDCDGVPNDFDNCPTVHNPGQENSDGDQFVETFDSPESLAAYTAAGVPAGRAWTVADGRLASPGSSGGAAYDAYLYRTDFTDAGSLRLSATLEETIGNEGGIGLAFRVVDGQHLYRFVNSSKLGHQRIEKVDGSTVTVLASRAAAVPHATPQRFTVEAEGTELRVFQGATLVLSASDASYPAGSAGFFAATGNGHRFDGPVVTPIDPRGDVCDPCPTEPSASCVPACLDADEDGFGLSHTSCGLIEADCAPGDATVNPGATETCDGLDNDCDGRADEECASAVTSYEYDNNAPIRVAGPDGTYTLEYDGNGNRTETAGSVPTQLRYDMANALVEMEHASGVTTMAYAASGQRVSLDETRYLLDGSYPLLTFGATDGDITHSVRGPGELLSERRDSAKVYFTWDAVRSILGATGGDGLLTAQVRYDVFGARLGGADLLSEIGFAGYSHDGTGLLHSLTRYHDPATGVWTQRDPLGAVDGPNVYAFVGQNPVSHVDPTGLMMDSFSRAMITQLHLFLFLVTVGFFGTAMQQALLRQQAQTQAGEASESWPLRIGPQQSPDPVLPPCPEDVERRRRRGPEIFFRGMELAHANDWITNQRVPDALLRFQAGLGAWPGGGPEFGPGLYMTRVEEQARFWAEALATNSPGVVHTVILIKIPHALWQLLLAVPGTRDGVPWGGRVYPGLTTQTYLPPAALQIMNSTPNMYFFPTGFRVAWKP